MRLPFNHDVWIGIYFCTLLLLAISLILLGLRHGEALDRVCDSVSTWQKEMLYSGHIVAAVLVVLLYIIELTSPVWGIGLFFLGLWVLSEADYTHYNSGPILGEED